MPLPATWDPSRIRNLRHSSWQHQILNPLSEARDQTHILMDTNWIHFLRATIGTPWWFFFFNKSSPHHYLSALICFKHPKKTGRDLSPGLTRNYVPVLFTQSSSRLQKASFSSSLSKAIAKLIQILTGTWGHSRSEKTKSLRYRP